MCSQSGWCGSEVAFMQKWNRRGSQSCAFSDVLASNPHPERDVGLHCKVVIALMRLEAARSQAACLLQPMLLLHVCEINSCIDGRKHSLYHAEHFVSFRSLLWLRPKLNEPDVCTSVHYKCLCRPSAKTSRIFSLPYVLKQVKRFRNV